MKLFLTVMPVFVSVAFFGCSRPEDKLREFSESECKSGIHNIYAGPSTIELGVLQLKRASFLGNRKAQLEFGVLYANGDGVTTDYEEAYAWLSIASNAIRPSDYSPPGGNELLQNDREKLAAMASLSRQFEKSGKDVQLQAQGALEAVCRKMSSGSVAKGEARARVIRTLILDEIQKKLVEIKEGK